MPRITRCLILLTLVVLLTTVAWAQEKSVNPGINDAFENPDVAEFAQRFEVEMRADQEVFHFLLQNHTKIRRQVERRDNGVETLTESDDPEVAKKIQEHVASMHQRVKEGRGLRFWDDLFVAIFERYPSIEMTVENTKQGVRVRETSEDPATVVLIQAHADVVSKFVELGFEEAQRNHPVPATDAKIDKEVRHLKDRLLDLLAQEKKLRETNAPEHELAEVREQIAGTERELHTIRAHRAGQVKPSPDFHAQAEKLQAATRRIHHLRVAAENLRLADAHDLALQLTEKAEAMERDVQEAKRRLAAVVQKGHGGEHGPDVVQELKIEVERLRAEVKELRQKSEKR